VFDITTQGHVTQSQQLPNGTTLQFIVTWPETSAP
jgi:hypothetical protein